MKNVIVTGGAGGIGSAIVKELKNNGYNPIVIDVDTTNSQRIKQEQGVDNTWSLDITDINNLVKFRDELSDDFLIEHIVCVAGRALENEWQPFDKQDIKEIKKSIELNLIGHINVIHTFLPILKKSKDDKSITLISSINALADFGLPAYSAAKSGMYGLVKSLCSEFGRDGIRINAISPGTIITSATELEPKNFNELLKGTALGRFATKEDIASLTKFIIEADNITGQNLVVDAGQSTILKK